MTFHEIIVKISNLDLRRVTPVCVFGISKQTSNLFKMSLFGADYDGRGKAKRPSSLKSATHTAMKKLGKVIPYLKKIKKYINHVTT